MRKILHLLVMVFMSMFLYAQNVGDTANVNCEDYSLRFTVRKLYPAECSVICTTCSAIPVEISIPSSVVILGREFKVVCIEEGAFMSEVGLASVEIPEGVKKIEQNAFRDCSNLAKVSMPNSVESIGSWAFMNCSSLASISIPEKVKCIKNATFSGCLSLESVVFHDNLESIEYYAFHKCSSLENIEIPVGVTSIGLHAFSKCYSLKTVVIPASVTDIGYGVFSYSNELESIIVESENPIYDSRNNCNAIIETATNRLVQACKNTIIPTNVVSIGKSSFEGILDLNYVEIPNGVVKIERCAFYASGLTKIFIPNSVKSIGSEAFVSCKEVESISVEVGNSVYDSRNDCNAIIKTSNDLLIVGCKNTVIPNDIVWINPSAFENCIGLTSIDIPESVEHIGDYAFRDCVNLKTAEIPSSVTTIGFYAFGNCTSLASIKCYAETLPFAYSGVFNACPEDMVIYVPGKSLELYSKYYPWKNHVIKSMTLSSPCDIYPNPVDDKLFVEAEMNIEEICIFDDLGRCQYIEMSSGQFVTLDLSDLSGGVYFVRIKSDGEFITKRFVKK